MNQWLGLSQFLPRGGAGPDVTPVEKVYLVLEGQMTVTVGGAEVVLRPMESGTIAPGKVRVSVNQSNPVCKIVVVMPCPAKAAS